MGMRLNASISGHACFEKIQISGHACFEKIQGKCDSMHLFLAMHVSRKSKENATQCIYLRRSMGAGKVCASARAGKSMRERSASIHMYISHICMLAERITKSS